MSDFEPTQPNRNVMRPSLRKEAEKSIRSPMTELPEGNHPSGEAMMSLSSRQTIKPSAIAENGRLLCFAPPLMMGFRGCPLALSSSKVRIKTKATIRRNYAKRRAYSG